MDTLNPFGGLVVVELANVLAGPAVGMFFAELGARVIKVENPGTGGDVTRSWRTADERDGSPGAYFAAVNWGKESVAVDLTGSPGATIVHDLVRRADILLSSYKAGDAERLGVDWDTLRVLNPRLIYGRITAYGDGDPRIGYDAVIQAETGFTSMNGTADSGPLKMPVALMDILAGHQLKEGILAALLRRERSGRGACINVSLFESGVSALANQAANTLMTGTVPGRIGSGHPNIVPYGTAYRCRDGQYLVVAVGTDAQFRGLGISLGDPDLAADPRFVTNPDRVAHRESLEELLRERVAEFEGAALLARLRKEGVPAGLVNDVGTTLEDPTSRELVLRDPAGAAAVRTSVFRQDGLPETTLSPPPRFAEHTAAVLEDFLGYPPGAIEELVRQGTIATNREAFHE